MRLIDADRARETATIDLVVHHLDRQPTIDAVPVVRCKECRHCDFVEFQNAVCGRRNNLVTKEEFCSYGERRTDHENL